MYVADMAVQLPPAEAGDHPVQQAEYTEENTPWCFYRAQNIFFFCIHDHQSFFLLIRNTH